MVGDAVVFSNNGTLAGHVQVGDHAVMGGLTAVHQFCRIGRYAITGGCSKIVQDIPPFMIADGNPAKVRGINLVGLERSGFPPESVKWIKEAFRLIYRSKYNTRQAHRSDPERIALEPGDQSDRRVHRTDRARHHSLGSLAALACILSCEVADRPPTLSAPRYRSRIADSGATAQEVLRRLRGSG